MLRLPPLVLLIAGVWGLVGCQPQGSSSGSANSSPSSQRGSSTIEIVGPNPADPAAGGESAVKTGAIDGATTAVTELPIDPVATASSTGETKPAGTSPESESASPPTSPVPAASKTSSAEEAGYVQAAVPGTPAELPQNRAFRPEGPEQALRITYDDLDLLKWLQMDPVTPDCVRHMPEWMRELNGKKVRLRGFMKPHEISTGFRRFIFVKDTGLCCFGPAGKIYDLIQVTLLKGTTTDYIELTPFDVIGTFRIEVAALDDTQEVYELFHIDDAKIVRK